MSMSYMYFQTYEDDFGPYDDCDEVTVFDTADFHSAIEAIKITRKIWMVAFVGAHCHHCHVMADAFKAAAVELDGVVNVGVVDCGGYNRDLCRSMEVKGGCVVSKFNL